MFKNRVTEADIRDWLDENGYRGRSAKFNELELHAVRRPGWLQIFRFHCTVESDQEDNERVELWGAVQDNETRTHQKTMVTAFRSQPEQVIQLETWKRELNQSAGGESKANIWSVGAMIAICVGALAIVAAVRSFLR